MPAMTDADGSGKCFVAPQNPMFRNNGNGCDLARLIKEKDWWVAKFWIVIVISVILRRVTSNELRQSIYENNDY